MALLWSSCVKSGDKMKTGTQGEMDNYAHLRQQMVDHQLVNRGIRDEHVLKIMRTVPRHEFVLDSELKSAYDDSPLPIGHDQTISQPYIVAYMTEKLELKGDEKVLEIGTGSGYQAAVLCEMGIRVFSIERIKELYNNTRILLNSLGYSPTLFWGDGFEGKPTYGPYDRILITAAAPEIPENLLLQLKPGGKMVVPLGAGSSQTMILIEKNTEGKITKSSHGLFAFVPMIKGPAK